MRIVTCFFLGILSADSALAVENRRPAQNAVPSSVVRQIERKTLRECTEAENQSSATKLEIPGGDLWPASAVLALLKYTHGIEPIGDAEAKIVRGPRHGSVRLDQYVAENQSLPGVRYPVFSYVPDETFFGTDEVAFVVRVNNTNFRVKFRVNVLHSWGNGESCRPPGQDRG